MNRGAMIAAAFACDALAGDPRVFPHPVRAIGLAITRGERGVRRFARGNRAGEALGGTLLAAGVIAASALGAQTAVRWGGRFGPDRFNATEVLLGWTTLALRDLIAESDAVLAALERGDLARARIQLARIVGRDCDALAAGEIARATIETLAESFCDGVVGPLYALAAGGVPLAFAFKAANTLDSMIGHIEAPYTDLGRSSARIDDICCYVPARLGALALCLLAPIAGGSMRAAWHTWRRDGDLHASPNAGQMEAAMAGALGVRLGGRNRYDGIARDTALLGPEFRYPGVADVRRARTLVVAGACAAAWLAAVAARFHA